MDDYTRSRFIQAVDKFNRKDFFGCHEILEDIWFDIRDDSRDFYQGMLHIAVGFYHLTKKANTEGTLIQLTKAKDKLAKYSEKHKGNYNGVDVNKLLKQIETILTELNKNKKPIRLPKITLQ